MCKCLLVFNNELTLNNENRREKENRFYEFIQNVTIEKHPVQENKIIPFFSVSMLLKMSGNVNFYS